MLVATSRSIDTSLQIASFEHCPCKMLVAPSKPLPRTPEDKPLSPTLEDKLLAHISEDEVFDPVASDDNSSGPSTRKRRVSFSLPSPASPRRGILKSTASANLGDNESHDDTDDGDSFIPTVSQLSQTSEPDYKDAETQHDGMSTDQVDSEQEQTPNRSDIFVSSPYPVYRTIRQRSTAVQVGKDKDTLCQSSNKPVTSTWNRLRNTQPDTVPPSGQRRRRRNSDERRNQTLSSKEPKPSPLPSQENFQPDSYICACLIIVFIMSLLFLFLLFALATMEKNGLYTDVAPAGEFWKEQKKNGQIGSETDEFCGPCCQSELVTFKRKFDCTIRWFDLNYGFDWFLSKVGVIEERDENYKLNSMNLRN